MAYYDLIMGSKESLQLEMTSFISGIKLALNPVSCVMQNRTVAHNLTTALKHFIGFQYCNLIQWVTADQPGIPWVATC